MPMKNLAVCYCLTLKTGPIVCSETPATNYQPTFQNSESLKHGFLREVSKCLSNHMASHPRRRCSTDNSWLLFCMFIFSHWKYGIRNSPITTGTKLKLRECPRTVILPTFLSQKAFIDYAIVSHMRNANTSTVTPGGKHAWAVIRASITEVELRMCHEIALN